MAARDDRWQSTRDSVNDIAERLYLPPVFWEPPLDYRQNDGDTPYDIPPPAEERPRARYLYTLSIAFSLVLHGAVLGYAGTYIFLSQPKSSASVESTGSISVELVDSDTPNAKRLEVASASVPAVTPESGEQQDAQTVEQTAQREPDTPNTPDEPRAPGKPDEPNAPDEPSVPDAPDEPRAPNEPDTPDAPPEQIDTKTAPSNGADDGGKSNLQEEPAPGAETEGEAKAEPALPSEAQPMPASNQQSEEVSTPQNVASIDSEPPLPVSNPRRDAGKSETAEQTGHDETASVRATSRNQHRSSYSRRTRANLRQVFAYRKSVRAYLAVNKPNGGRGKGTVRVTFILSSTGRVVAARVTRSSGKRVLDQAALSAVYDASPFPPPPPGIRTSRLRFSIPFYFR